MAPLRPRPVASSGRSPDICAPMGQPHPRQPAGNRRSRQPEAGRDPLTRQPVLAAQLGRQSNPERTRRRLGRMGLGRVVLQPGFSIAPPARQPFAGGSFADPEARCHFADRPPPPTIRRIISARPSGVVRAFLCGLFVLVPCGASCRNDHLQALTGDEQPPQTPHLVGMSRVERALQEAPIDRPRQPHQSAIQRDDLIQPGPKQIASTILD